MPRRSRRKPRVSAQRRKSRKRAPSLDVSRPRRRRTAPQRRGTSRRSRRKRRLSNKVTVGVSSKPARKADMGQHVEALVDRLIEHAGRPVVFYHTNERGDHVNSWRYLPRAGTLEVWDVNGNQVRLLSPTHDVIHRLRKRINAPLRVSYPVRNDLKNKILHAEYGCREYNDALFGAQFAYRPGSITSQ